MLFHDIERFDIECLVNLIHKRFVEGSKISISEYILKVIVEKYDFGIEGK